MRRRHVAWAAGFVVRSAGLVAGPDEAAAAPTLGQERANVRAALRRLTPAGGCGRGGDPGDVVEVGRALAAVCLYRPDPEWLRWLREAARWATGGDEQTEQGEQALALRACAARAAYLQGDLGAVDALARRAVEASADPPTVHLARHSLGVAALYAGRHDDAEAWWAPTSTDAAAGLPARLDALGGIALARCYRGDLAGSAEALGDHRGLAEAVDSDTYRAFGDYVAGEAHLAAGRVEEAAAVLDTSARRAGAAGADFVEGLALTTLVSARVRSGRLDAAARALPAVLEGWRRSATWPQLWTTLRLVAQVLEARGAAAAAALVLDAAARDAAAPALSGDDVDRLARLRASADARLSPDERAAVARRARLVPRSRVLAEALDALGRLT